MSSMKVLIKNSREAKNLKIKDIANALGIDPALVSKWESGTRKPTKEQVLKLASVLEIDTEKLLIEWMSEIILYEIGNDDLALQAMQLAEEKVKLEIQKRTVPMSKSLLKILKDIDKMKLRLNEFRHLDSYRIAQAMELEYTFESNRIEGNTLTLKETDLVINEGITISGKSMREHLEAINHKEAVEYLKHLVEKNTELKERDILQLHNLILRGIDSENAGKYRNVQVMIKGSKHLPPQPYLVAKAMEELMIWYRINYKNLHPVVLAAELSERLVTIHPFIDGNGRTSRLIMNLILLKHGYVIANIKGDDINRLNYYNCLESVQVSGKKEVFYEFIAEVEREALKRYLEVLGG
jgi:Fic family protein/DNA-binding XRE family transcriptional regulator